MRKFEKISIEQFTKDIKNDIDLYNQYELPKRTSTNAAGYDIFLLEDLTINPGEIKKIPTGVKSSFNEDEVLLLVVRSSMGFKYNIRLCNQVGIIDADYYNNKDNEGHIWVRIQNEGEETVTIPKGKSVAQCLFMKFLTTDDDNNTNNERIGKY